MVPLQFSSTFHMICIFHPTFLVVSCKRAFGSPGLLYCHKRKHWFFFSFKPHVTSMFLITFYHFYSNSSRRKMNLFILTFESSFMNVSQDKLCSSEIPVCKPSKSPTVISLTYIWPINLFLKKAIRQGEHCLSFDMFLAFICSFLLLSTLISLILLSFLFLGNCTWFVSYLSESFSCTYMLPYSYLSHWNLDLLVSFWVNDPGSSFPLLIPLMYLNDLVSS